MTWFSLAASLGPELLTLFRSTTAPVSKQVTLNAKPSASVKNLQHLLNHYFPSSKPLAEDGWLGPHTEAALVEAVNRVVPLIRTFLDSVAKK